MNRFSKLLTILWLLGLGACTTEPSSPQALTPATNGEPNSIANPSPDSAPVHQASSRPTCKLVGSVLEGNMFWAADENRFVVISAEKETEDKDLGESHRILTVYDGKCSQVFRQVLPINFSADYPYYLSEITYNKVSKQVAIRGYDKFYVLDLAAMKLSEPLVPKFLTPRLAEDAQSGAIKRLELWENYVVGFAASMGPFVYDLTNVAKPAPVMPLAEYPIVKGEQYSSLFLLKSTDADNGYQAFAPDYDYEKEAFSLNILFDKPMKFVPNINKSFKNNQYILLKEQKNSTESTPHAVDMKTRKTVELPADLAAKKDTEIIAWLKKQQ